MLTARVDEIANGIYRINIPVPPTVVPGGFSFNQYLIDDDQPLLFHTGSRRLFPAVSDSVRRIIPLKQLRYVGFSHHEQDEDGALNQFLAAADNAEPVCGTVNALINGDGMDRPPRVLRDGETLKLGKHSVRWLDASHLPHGWETGYLFDEATKTLLCGDLFTQPGAGDVALTESDVLGPSETFRTQGMDYFAHGRDLPAQVERLASTEPTTLACMHGSAWTGDGGRLLRYLAASLDKQ
jgi:flavorubredoxin